jgi:hypothetical protein
MARGKTVTHIASNGACGNCHTTNAWTPARFDHGSLAQNCTSCHDAVHATGMPVNHVPTRAPCSTCHGTLSWRPAKLDHSMLRSACASCHNGAIATGALSTHLHTQRDCATCHVYPDWNALVFRHASAAYPGQHKSALECASCHSSNTDQVPWLAAANAGTCAGCHAKDFKADAHPATERQKYTAGELANCAGACHVYGNSEHSVIVKRMPGPYHRVSDGSFKH